MIVEHIGITVSNLDKSIEFYKKLLGFKVLRKTPISAYLYLGNDLVELMQTREPQRAKQPKNTEEWNHKMFDPLGLSHIGFRVDNLDQAIEKVEKLGGRIVIPSYKFEPKIEFVINPKREKLKRASQPPKPKTWWRIACFADPDGTILELLER